MVWLAAIDDHKTGPKQKAIFLEQLFLLIGTHGVSVQIKLLWIEQSASVYIVFRLSASKQARPQVGDAS